MDPRICRPMGGPDNRCGPAGFTFPAPSGLEGAMFYQVTVYKPDGTLKRRVSSQALLRRHWKLFEASELGRKGRGRGLTIGRVAAEMNKDLKKFLAFEKVCDEFTYHYGV